MIVMDPDKVNHTFPREFSLWGQGDISLDAILAFLVPLINLCFLV
jgi:hypothetical protein